MKFLAIALAFLSVSAESNDDPSAAETEAMNNYAAASIEGRHAAAAKFILDYMEKTEGENAPLTVARTQRYGNLLRKEGDIREAISVLKKARKRGIIAFGEYGIELFEINLDLGEAYVDRDIGVGKPKKYFDYALEVLRENGQRETPLYVTALAGIASRLAQAGALEGVFSADTNGDGLEELADSGLTSIMRKYKSGHKILDDYLQEAFELAEALESEDPYLSAKVAIVQARIRVIDTMYLEVVPPNIRGSISGATARKYHLQEDKRLLSAIDSLVGDAEQNQDYLDIANGARMEIAWILKDKEQMTSFCSSNTLNMASRYPPDRLFEISDDGSVIAPRFSFKISRNIFRQLSENIYDKRLNVRSLDNWGPTERPGIRPHFLPVCIDGRLMAALINSPLVTIEEID